MVILFNGICKKNNIDYIIFMTEDGVSIDIPIEKTSADRISKYLQRISPGNNLDNSPQQPERCAICLQEFVSGDIIVKTTKISNEKNLRGFQYIVNAHEVCDKTFQEISKQTVPLKDILNK